MPFTFTPLALPGLVLVEPKLYGDARGWFMETYKRSEFEAAGIHARFVQDAHAKNAGRGTLRGMHYQLAAAAQGKLVRVLVGEMLDVVVDVRRGSPTFGRAASVALSAENRRMLWIPPGFAHGYCTTSEACEIHYKFTHEYSPAHERAIRWDDPALGIAWPTSAPILSEKDRKAPLLKDAEIDLAWTG